MVLLVTEVSPLQSLSCFVFGTSKLSASKYCGMDTNLKITNA